MIFLRLMVDNLYMFQDTTIDFTYPRRIQGSLIEGEYLDEFPQVRFKRVCIIMGPNASGKTTLGRLMCLINNYLSGRSIQSELNNLYDKKKSATIDLLYVIPAIKELRRLRIEFDHMGLLRETLWITPLRKYLSIKSMEERLQKNTPTFDWSRPKKDKDALNESNAILFSQAIAQGKTLDNLTGWHYIFSEFDVSSGNLAHEQQELTLLEKVLRAFDTSIDSVRPSQDKDNAYVIRFRNGDRVIVEDGELRPQDRRRMSRGTLESIEVAKLLATIINNNNQDESFSNTFFLDEKMAYSHTEMEAAILNVMIERLGPYSQLFYTTHNHDILSMALPSHTFLFMHKDEFVQVSQPEKLGFSKNDRNLLGYVRNDVFGTIPKTNQIDALLE